MSGLSAKKPDRTCERPAAHRGDTVLRASAAAVPVRVAISRYVRGRPPHPSAKWLTHQNSRSLWVQFRSQRQRVPGTPASGRPLETTRVRSRCRGWLRSCFAAVGPQFVYRLQHLGLLLHLGPRDRRLGSGVPQSHSPIYFLHKRVRFHRGEILSFSRCSEQDFQLISGDAVVHRGDMEAAGDS